MDGFSYNNSESEHCTSDCDKENCAANIPDIRTSRKRKSSSTSKPEQIQKIQLYMRSHDDFSKGKTSESQERDWDNFIEELNACGPPVHTGKEWRKIWSDWKGNQKRKQLPVGTMAPYNTEVECWVQSETNEMLSSAQTGQLIDQMLPANEDSLPSKIDTKSEDVHFQILKTLNVVVEQQKETNCELKNLNENFREFIDLFKQNK